MITIFPLLKPLTEDLPLIHHLNGEEKKHPTVQKPRRPSTLNLNSVTTAVMIMNKIQHINLS